MLGSFLLFINHCDEALKFIRRGVSRPALRFCSRVFPFEVNTPKSTFNAGVGYLLWFHRQSKHRRVERQQTNHLPFTIYTQSPFWLIVRSRSVPERDLQKSLLPILGKNKISTYLRLYAKDPGWHHSFNEVSALFYKYLRPRKTDLIFVCWLETLASSWLFHT